MSDLSGVVSRPNFGDWVYDPRRDAIDFTTTDGSLYSWSVASQGYAFSMPLSGSPGAIDISPDGSFLLVGHRNRIVTSDPSATSQTYANVITRVDLATHGVQNFQFAITDAYEGGIGDLAIGADGNALLTTYFLGSGSTPFREFSPSTSSFAVISGLGTFNKLYASGGSSGQLILSEDRRYVLLQEVGISSGPMYVYDTLTDTRIGKSETSNGAYQFGVGDISSAAGLVVDVLYNSLFVTDLSLKLIRDLSSYTTAGRISGAGFNDGGHQLFLWQGAAKSVLVLDTLTWKHVATMSVASPLSGFGQLSSGPMDVISSGRVLVLDLGTGLELIDLAARLKINLSGDATSEALHGAVGTDSLSGGAGADTINGYAGDDLLHGDDGLDYLRGDEGNDSIAGGADFDDINGNMGNDTASGGTGDDWVVGGKDNDLLFGDAGADLVYGNLGNDTCEGGEGNDIVRGGQQDDVIIGGAGDDYVSGDRGDDTVTGGAGADNFHTFGEAGLDRVLDFSISDGDRVQLDPGTQYTVTQSGADTVISMTGGGQMVLVGVQLSSLPAGWIFGA